MNFVNTGTKYSDECPVENMIPIYLIVLGSTSLFYTCCVGGSRGYQSYNPSGDQGEEQSVNPIRLLLDLFLLAWFICGYVWIYRNYQPNYDDPESDDYCNKTLYLFAFWASTSYLIASGIGLLLTCALHIFIPLFGNRCGNLELHARCKCCCWTYEAQ